MQELSNLSSRRKPFVWTGNEVDLLLSILLEYKISKTAKNSDILSFQYYHSIVPHKAQQRSAEFPHKENELTKVILTSKMKPIRSTFHAAIDSGRRIGHGKLVLFFCDICQEKWGDSPATTTDQQVLKQFILMYMV